MFGKEKQFVANKIAKVQELIIGLQSSKNLTEKEYKETRVAINCAAIEAATGAQIIEKGAEAKLKFNQDLPTKAELNQLRTLLTSLLEWEYDNVFPKDDDEDDMSVNPMATMSSINIPQKSGLKDISSLCIGSNTAAYTQPLSGDDIMTININAEEARKRFKRNVIIGVSIFAVVTLASVCVGVGVYKYKHKDDNEDDIDDITDDDINDIVTMDDDNGILDIDDSDTLS